MRHSLVAAVQVTALVLALSPAAAAPKAPEPSKADAHGRARSKAATSLEQAEAAFLDGDLEKAERLGARSAAFNLLLQAQEAFIAGDLVAAKHHIDDAVAAGGRAAAHVMRAKIYARLAHELQEQSDASLREALKLRPGDPGIERLLSLPASAPCR